MIFQALALAGLAHAQRGDASAARADFVRAGEVGAAQDPESPQVAQMAALVARHDLILGDSAAARSGVEHALAAADFRAPLTQESFVLHAGLACFEVLSALGDPARPRCWRNCRTACRHSRSNAAAHPRRRTRCSSASPSTAA